MARLKISPLRIMARLKISPFRIMARLKISPLRIMAILKTQTLPIMARMKLPRQPAPLCTEVRYLNSAPCAHALTFTRMFGGGGGAVDSSILTCLRIPASVLRLSPALQTTRQEPCTARLFRQLSKDDDLKIPVSSIDCNLCCI
jgi:hypothetical protein